MIMSPILSNNPPQQPLENHNSNEIPRAEQTGHKQSHESSSTEPFPGFESQPAFQYNASLHTLDTNPSPTQTLANLHSPLTGLRLQTEHLAQKNRQESRLTEPLFISETVDQTNFNAGLPVRNSSIRSSHSARQFRSDSLSPGSTSSSPAIGPFADMTPLPSPISSYGSPSRWRKSVDEGMNDPETESQSTRTSLDSAQPSMFFDRTPPKKRKIPIIGTLGTDIQPTALNGNGISYNANRSVSEYIPEGLQAPKGRNIVVSTSGAPDTNQQISTSDEQLHREQCLAVQRGLVSANLPTPPVSSRGSECDDLQKPTSPRMSKVSAAVVYEAVCIRSGKIKRWRGIRPLGEGQFSKVMLAIRETVADESSVDTDDLERAFDPHSLVAVKICHHGPAGGADEKSLETSIKRELGLMKSIDHPSLIHLEAWGSHHRQTLFVINYCPGGDLFELASTNLDMLKPPLVRRIFAELVCAVQYLHAKHIVHRDIKLENVLVNIRPEQISNVADWRTYGQPIIVLSDLGLGREIPKPPESPLLRRRCGSEDYAAPEVLIGQDYDGRSTDAWALGVVLYTLMEGRMPFDPVPGSRRKPPPTSHRIARCEWQWVKYADADGEWDPVKGKDFEGAREIVEGLLARTRSRWSLDKVQETGWVAGAIEVPGGLKRGHNDT